MPTECEYSECSNIIDDGSHGNRKFCSLTCRRKNTAKYEWNDRERICRGCSIPFTADSPNQRYCERTCTRKHENEKRRMTSVDLNEPLSGRDEQMEKLFRYYEEQHSIVIDERPEGSRLVILSDLQLPFVDEPLLRAVNRFIKDFKPHDIIYNGDIIDCYEVSDFDKRPARMFNLDDECEMAKDILRQHKRESLPDTKLWWIDGNHEQRYQRVIWRRASGFEFAVKDLAELLELDELTEGFVPYGKHIEYLGFTITHGNFVSQFSGYTARRHYDRYHSSGANGHTHRLGAYYHTDMHGKQHAWFEGGCICRKDLEYVKGVANWQQGFMIGTVLGGALHPQIIHVIEYKSGKRGFYANGTHYPIFDEI
jgi:hypothetical protein